MSRRLLTAALLLSLLPSAAMMLVPYTASAFPSTGILDSFNGGDESPITTNWTVDLLPTAAPFNLRLASNKLAPVVGAGNPGSAWYDLATFGPDCEEYLTIPSVTGIGNVALFLRGQAPGTTGADGYSVIADPVGAVTQVHRWVDEAPTQLGSNTSTAWAAGDALGATVTGVGATVTITVYRKPSGGSWGVIATETDTNAARIVSAGVLGVFMNGAVGTGYADDVGGGTIVEGLLPGGTRPTSMF